MAAPDLNAFAAMATRAVDGFPEPFRALAGQVAVHVAEWPDAAMLADLGIDNPLDLTGLYDGTPLTEQSASDPSPYPDVVWLFRAPILDELATRPGLALQDLITHVVVHEFAHHFGWSDDDIAAIDQWWE
ncbi:MAG: metallopeptidase family protein [Pseudomonadota bacterium]